MESKDKCLSLKVCEQHLKDVGRGIARIDPAAMQFLELEIGDIIEISGKKSTVAKVMPAYVNMREQELIQIDGCTRENTGLSIGDKVLIRKAEYKRAEKVTLINVDTSVYDKDEKDGSYIRHLIDGLALIKDNKIRVNLMGSRVREFIIDSVNPEGVVIINQGTRINIINSKISESHNMSVTYEDIGGLGNELIKIREMIELPLRHPELFEKLGIDAPKGVLLHGSPGTGKTLIAKAVANETSAYFISINGPEIMNKYYGESEARLREVFETAVKNSPSIIFIDELDAIAPKREETKGDVEKRVVAQLLTLMDGIKTRGKVIVIGATNIPNSLDPALRRPGRFDREIRIGIPDTKGRFEILNIHTRGMPLSSDVNLKRIAELTGGFVGADLKALCREAAMITLRNILNNYDINDETALHEALFNLNVTMGNFITALRQIEPSVIRDVIVEAPEVKWEDIGGLNEVKQRFKEIVQWPVKYRDIYTYANISLPKGILLFGAPGTGKTLLAKAMANELGFNFICVKGPELMSKWFGESEKNIREVFRKAKEAAPSIIFFDEIDCLMPCRESSFSSDVNNRVLSQILIELDGIQQLEDVLIIGATNRKELIDPALLRPGRFDIHIEIGNPDFEARKEIFRIHLLNRPIEASLDYDYLAGLTEGLTGADIKYICDQSAMCLAREYIQKGADSENLYITTGMVEENINQNGC